MSITSIVFYSYYHNGDLYVSKQFLRAVADQLTNVNLSYYHFNHPGALHDIGIRYGGTPVQFPEKAAWVVTGDLLAVNTWVGAYQPPCDPPPFYQGGINLHMLYDIWSFLCDQLSPIIGQSLQLRGTAADYAPRIDYSQFDVSNVDQFISARSRKTILICNGAAMSGQSFAHNMQDIVQWLADRHPLLDFVCTSKFPTEK